MSIHVWAPGGKARGKVVAASLLLLMVFGLSVGACPPSSFTSFHDVQAPGGGQPMESPTLRTGVVSPLADSEAFSARAVALPDMSAHCLRSGTPSPALPAQELRVEVAIDVPVTAAGGACPAGNGMQQPVVLEMGPSAPSLTVLSISRT